MDSLCQAARIVMSLNTSFIVTIQRKKQKEVKKDLTGVF
jgi:hypothetical protein